MITKNHLTVHALWYQQNIIWFKGQMILKHLIKKIRIDYSAEMYLKKDNEKQNHAFVKLTP